MYNQIRFNPQEYGDDAIVEETKFAWLRINTQI